MTNAVMTTVGAVLQRIEAGRSTKTLERPAKDGELGILRVSAVTWGEFRPGENKAMPLDYDPGNVPRPMQGDILISRANTRELVGAPVMVETDHPNLLLSDKILRLVPDCNIVAPRYLLRALRSQAAALHFSQCAGGTSGSMTNITQGDIRATPLRLPSLSEQHRIAAILDKADALRAKRREAIAKLDQLLQSVFLEMFGDPVTNPKGWPEGSIDIVASDRLAVRCGPFGTQLKVHELTESGVPLWGIENVHDNRFVGSPSKFVSPEKATQLQAFEARPGDVLITRMGTIGRACVVPSNTPAGRISYHLFRIRPDPAKCLPEFLAATISRSGTFAQQLKKLARGAIMAGLNTTVLKEVKFLLPPLELQRSYLDKVVAIDAVLARQLQSAAQLEHQFASLQHSAFTSVAKQE